MLQANGVPFKVLILDSATQAILSSLLRVSDLRNCGITVHFLDSSERTELKDVPAVYFVSDPNVIIRDLTRNLYHSYFLNISSTFSRLAIEKLAQEASEKQISNKIISIKDQFINFNAIEEDFFTLNMKNSFLNRDDTHTLRQIITSLFSIFVTLNEMPFIVGDYTELGKMLCQKIENMKIIKSSVKKSLLIIFNRDSDLINPCRHVIGYLDLINDILKIDNNKIECGKEVFNIDTDCDFYKKNRFLDFPHVAELVEKELHEYKKEMALRSITDRSDKAAINKALESVPYLKSKNEMINTHLNLCMKVVEEMKKRKLDDFYKIENEFLKDEIHDLVENGTNEDVERLCITMIGGQNCDLIEPILKTKGIENNPLNKLLEKLLTYIGDKTGGDGGIREKFKKLLFRKSLPICDTIEDVLTSVKKQSFEKFNCYDPGKNGLYFPEISKVIVFVNGGVTYSELKAIKDIEKAYKMPIILGGTEVLNAQEFIRQLKEYVNKE